MTWEREIEELRKRQALAHELGGAERVKRHPRDTRHLLCEFVAVSAPSIQPGRPSYGHRP